MNTLKRAACASAAALALAAGPAAALDVYPVRDGVYMLSGPNGNTTVFAGKDGVVVVDPGSAAVGADVLAEIRKLSSKPIRYVLDTNASPDRTGANAVIASAGVALDNTRPASAVATTGGAPIYAHEQVMNQLTDANVDAKDLPTDTYFVAEKDFFTSGQPVQLLHVKNAYSGGDSVIMFRRLDVIAAGDLYNPDRYPMIDLQHGGSINGIIDGLNYLIRLTIPEVNEEGGTLVIPGHGRISDEGDLTEYRDMVTIVRDRVQDMIKRKMTLAQVKAAGPTADYDPVFGGAAAGQQFTEAVYRSLTQAKPTTERREP